VSLLSSDFYPLDEFYAARGMELPLIRRLQAMDLPEPYRQLLAHEGDMTSRLEKFHHDRIRIQLLERRTGDGAYFREVTLWAEQKVVEFGAIKIMIDLFPTQAQREIRQEKEPLGKILVRHGVAFSSQPRIFLGLMSDAFISGLLSLKEPSFLYGRRNTLVDSRNRPLAEIVEILPPTAARRVAAGAAADLSSSFRS